MASLISGTINSFRRKQKQQQQQQQQKQYTSIEEIFHFELLAVKLCAGFMFNGNVYLCLFYRAIVIIWAKYCQATFLISHQKSLYQSLTKAVLQNMNFFYLFYVIATISATIATIVSSLNFHKLLMIILNKRFDRRYLDNTKAIIELDDEDNQLHLSLAASRATAQRDTSTASSSLSSLPPKSANSSSGSFYCSSKDAGYASASSLTKSPVNKMKPIINLGRTVQVIERMSRVTTLRWFFMSYLSLIVFSSFGQNEYSKWYQDMEINKQREVLKVPSANGTAISDLLVISEMLKSIIQKRDVQNQSFPFETKNETLTKSPEPTSTTLTSETTNQSSGALDRNFLQDALNKLKERKTNSFKRLASISSYLARMLIFHSFNTLTNFYQIYGQVLITLMITATLSDILRRINEQDQLMMAVDGFEKNEEWFQENIISSKREIVTAESLLSSGSGSTTRSQHNRTKCSVLLLPTTDILIQTRDILMVLRKAVGIDYLAIQTYDVSQLIVLFGSIMALIATNKVGWLITFSINYIQVVVSIILTRITYHWLHSEARKISLSNEQRLVDCSLNLDKPTSDKQSRDSEPSVWSTSSDNVFRSNFNQLETNQRIGHYNDNTSLRRSSRTNNDQSNAAQRRNQGVTRIEAITNYRLAKEIEKMWPTDWFEPDLKSCLSLNLFVATFVATLQQLVEASIKVTSNQTGG